MTHMPLSRALSWIVGTTLVFTVTTHKVLRHVFSSKPPLRQEEMIAYMVQTGPCREMLHSDYLMELLQLSVDKPTPFSSLDPDNAREKILSCSPVIREVGVKKIPPNTVYVDYTVRKPIARLADFYNTAIDRDKVLFPLYPFFSPKKLPDVYLGQEGSQNSLLGKTLEGAFVEKALEILDLLQAKGQDLFVIQRIDVSRMKAESLGKREIIVALDQETSPPVTHYLRLTPRHFAKEIDHYLQLRGFLLSSEQQAKELLDSGNIRGIRTIDLRLDQLAFIQ
ncbi:MAG: FtsQ-type POTRA domain-containing protein [Chlamydiae bacterium]|nr:FtsQ-type POTRA domain-containing protein [Chlamydiota bacterium]